MTRLSLTVPFHLDEHTDSVMSRVAAANGDSLSIFIGNMGLDRRGLKNWDDECFAKAAYLAGIEQSSLIGRAVRKQERGVAVAGHYMPESRIKRFRFNYCPLCLEEDRTSGTGLVGCRPYGRLIWLVDFITCCPEHGIALMEANEGRDLKAGSDFSRQMAELAGRGKQTIRQPTEFELYTGRRLVGLCGTATPFLEQHPLHVVVGICEAVGTRDIHGINVKKQELTEEDMVEIRQRGFDVLLSNQDGFRNYIGALADAALKGNTGLKGRNIYGPIYSDLRRKLNHVDFDHFRQIIREVSVERLPLGPEDDLFGPLPPRRWHSLHSASKEFKIGASTLSKISSAAGIIDAGTHGTAASYVVVEATRMKEFVKAYRESLDAAAAVRYLAVPTAHWEQVVVLSGISPLTLRPGRRNPLYKVADLDRFVARLAGGRAIKPSGSHDQGHVDILSAREIAKCRLIDIFGLLLNGELEKVTRTDTATGLTSIYVDPVEVNVRTAGLVGRTVNFNQLGGKLSSLPDRVTSLVEAGYLSISSPLEIDGDIRQAKFMAWSVELFHERHRILRDLADRMWLEPRHVRRLLVEAGISPLLNEAKPSYSFYDIREVERFEAEELIK
ncbi:TniQ family protein [Agrobacterium vaccinii]|uniref:TniQ family protein n=1 Tax=Agrobacterium vaccinii TaxID=2735528 RepID=UPI001E4B5C6F|nr:TniQ family protein [Agrobacterium vaccinii]UHS61337.1 TniQ family protein [Agrobacterium vaccinii]